MKFARGFLMCTATFAFAMAAAAGTAAAAPTTVPFQINTAPYGNPNGSFDSAPSRCVAIVGEQPGVVTVAGANPGGWGCEVSAALQWVNLSTGVTGAARTSDGLFGFPSKATLHTGPGRIALILSKGGITTPGFATFDVP
ncbi:hypothetical protein [Nocardia mexicana]|uniref:Secreted protein n=1 Tax=Nocardia mexicana TaxID=279262 RepID=A0A370H0H6_9NOCA|nr:hypothetical protein [Nocardia mexicana]RDI49434.1 hypothetical protein DFR68_107562 [Nocardia mexicana]